MDFMSLLQFYNFENRQNYLLFIFYLFIYFLFFIIFTSAPFPSLCYTLANTLFCTPLVTLWNEQISLL